MYDRGDAARHTARSGQHRTSGGRIGARTGWIASSLGRDPRGSGLIGGQPPSRGQRQDRARLSSRFRVDPVADRDHAYVAAWHRYDVGGHDAGHQAPEQLGRRSTVWSHGSDELDSVRPSIGWVALARHRAAGAWTHRQRAGKNSPRWRSSKRTRLEPTVGQQGGTSVAAGARSSLGRHQGPKQIGSGAGDPNARGPRH